MRSFENYRSPGGFQQRGQTPQFYQTSYTNNSVAATYNPELNTLGGMGAPSSPSFSTQNNRQ